MRKAVEIFRVHTRHKKFGNNWGTYKVAASNADEALKEAKKLFIPGECLESLELLASTR